MAGVHRDRIQQHTLNEITRVRRQYQQLLVSYQSANRIGSSDGALLYLCAMAEAEQTRMQIVAKQQADERTRLHLPRAWYEAKLAAAAEELGFDFKAAPRVGSDSSAARSVAGRHGLGRLKHVEAKYLWVQPVIHQGRVVVQKEVGEDTPWTCSPSTSRRTKCCGFWTSSVSSFATVVRPRPPSWPRARRSGG